MGYAVGTQSPRERLRARGSTGRLRRRVSVLRSCLQRVMETGLEVEARAMETATSCTGLWTWAFRGNKVSFKGDNMATSISKFDGTYELRFVLNVNSCPSHGPLGVRDWGVAQGILRDSLWLNSRASFVLGIL